MSDENNKIGTVVKCDDHQAIVRVQHALTCVDADPSCPYNAMYFGMTIPETLEMTAENHLNANVGLQVLKGFLMSYIPGKFMMNYFTAFTTGLSLFGTEMLTSTSYNKPFYFKGVHH